MHGRLSGELHDRAASGAVPERDLRIDLFRGLSLWLIYLDHIPDNVLGRITLRNFGFSDAAEIFIFISGFTCGLVYGGLARQRGLLTAWAHVWRRAWQIYAAMIFLFVAYAVEVTWLAAGRTSFLDDTNLAVLLRDPATTLLQVMALRYAPVNMDALILIVILHLAFPAMLLGLLKMPLVTLGISAALYASMQAFDWSISAYPTGSLYFNPLGWQLLFVIGAWIGLDGTRRLSGVLRSRVLVAICLAYIAASFVIVIGWQWPALQIALPEAVTRFIYPVDKGSLDLLRLLHFLALAVIAWRFIPSNHSLLRTRALLPIIRCGEYSLVLFCLGVLLSFAAHVALHDLSKGLAIQLVFSATGIVLMIAVATLLAKVDKSSSAHPRTI